MTYSQNESLTYKYAGRQAMDRWQLLALGGLKLVVGRASVRDLMTVELPLLALLALIATVAATVPSGRDLGLLDGDISQIVFCPFYLLTGIPCLFCGITRSFLAMGHLQLSQAFIFHPLGPLFYLSLVVLIVLLVFSLAGRRQFRIGVEAKLRKKLLVAGLVVLLAAWLVKLVVWYQVGLLEFWASERKRNHLKGGVWMASLPMLQADMRQKTSTDWQTNFWPAFLLSIVTCGIYGLYILYKLLDRRLQHFERMVSLRGHLIEVLKERAEAAGKTAELEQDFGELEGLNFEATTRDRAGEKTPVLWLVLGIVVGVTNFYVYYFLNDDFRAHEANEQRFMAKASEIMAKLGMPDQPILPDAVVPERNFVVFLILSLVTCGIYTIYWWYTLITDPNLHFNVHNAWEARLETAVTAGGAA